MKRLSENERNNVFFKMLDSIDACVYISDPYTHEVLFINKKMNKLFGGGKIEGSICWQTLQEGMPGQCDFCAVKQLLKNPDTPVVWEEFNSATKRYFTNTDTMVEWIDGSTVHMQHSVDVTEFKNNVEMNKKKLKQQDLLFALSMSFASKNDLKDMITQASQHLGEYFDASRVFWLTDNGCETMNCECGWKKSGTQFIPKTILGDIKKYTSENPIILSRKQIEAATFAEHVKNAQSLISMSLLDSGQVLGVICLEDCEKQIQIETEDDFEYLNIVKNIIETGVSRKIKEEAIVQRDKKLENAVKEAEKANKAKSEFLSRMSHEIRTPMNAIMGMTSIAKNAKDPNKVKDCLGKIDISSKHLLDIINDILDMSKIEAEKFELIKEDFNLEKMLMDICNIILHKVDEKKQTLSVNISKDIKEYYRGDSLRLTQVITNLLSNAVKFSPVGATIRLIVEKKEQVDGRTMLSFEVHDNGIGISDEHLSRLFTPFEQADGGIARKFGGTGLGLAICKKIVGLMGGDITVESELGKGSVFRCTVLVEDSLIGNKTELSSAINKKELRVLAVDDSLEIREFFSDLLSERNINYSVAESGEEGLRLFVEAEEAGHPYNIVFMDWNLPGMNGIEATERIRKQKNIDNIIILMSITDWSMLEESAKSVGITKHLSKPLFPSEIIDLINNVLGKQDASTVKEEICDFSGKKILLFEDVDINVEIIMELLADTKATIVSAANGRIGLELFKKDIFDLVLMDVNMPVMNGYDVTKAIRALPQTNAKTVPIIAMTANAFQSDILNCRQAGMDDHIAKPVDEKILLKMLNQYLKKPAPAPAGKVADNEEKDIYAKYLPYINVADGLSRVRGNKKLFVKLLKIYQQNTDIEKIDSSLKAGNLVEAGNALHSFKGVSANLSVTGNFECSKKMEQLMKESRNIEEAFDSLKENVKITFPLIERLISELEA